MTADGGATSDATSGRAGAWREVVVVLLAIFAVVVAAAQVRHGLVRAASIAVSLVAYALLAGVVLLAVRLRKRPAGAALGLERERPGRQALVALAVAAGLALVVLGLPVAFGAQVTDIAGPPAGSAGVLAGNVARAVFVVGPVEELVFRGYLLGRLCELVRPGWAAVLSAVAFGLWHFPGGQDWLQVGTTTLIGLALAVIRLRVRGASIPALGLGHGLYDAGLAVAAFLAG